MTDERFSQLTSLFLDLESSLPDFDSRFMSFLRNRDTDDDAPTDNDTPTFTFTAPDFTVIATGHSQDFIIPILPTPVTRLRLTFTFSLPQLSSAGLLQLFWLVAYDTNRHKGLNRYMPGYAMFDPPNALRIRSGWNIGQAEKRKIIFRRFTPNDDTLYRLFYEYDFTTRNLTCKISTADTDDTVVLVRDNATGEGIPSLENTPLLLQRGYPRDHGVEHVSPLGTYYGPCAIELQ